MECRNKALWRESGVIDCLEILIASGSSREHMSDFCNVGFSLVTRLCDSPGLISPLFGARLQPVLTGQAI